MKKFFTVPEIEIVSFNAEILTDDNASIGDGDVDVNWDDLE